MTSAGAEDASLRESAWDRVDRILELARNEPEDGRAALIKREADGDDEVRREVESLLAHAERADRLFDEMSESVAGPDVSASKEHADESLVGTTVGGFRLDTLLAGGMNSVYRAWDAPKQRPVLLKLTPHGLAGVERKQAIARLEREAVTESHVHHPNTCRIFDHGVTADGRGFLVKEFCEGQTLRQQLRIGPLTPAEACRIGGAVAGALAAVHAEGLIHRDVKPANVMVGPDGEVKLLDFGVVKIEGARMTRTGQVLGTVDYMSPERLSMGEATSATDVWSLGVTLMEAATGRHPFRRESRGATIVAIQFSEVASRTEARLPARLKDVVLGTVRVDASERPTARELELALLAV